MAKRVLIVYGAVRWQVPMQSDWCFVGFGARARARVWCCHVDFVCRDVFRRHVCVILSALAVMGWIVFSVWCAGRLLVLVSFVLFGVHRVQCVSVRVFYLCVR